MYKVGIAIFILMAFACERTIKTDAAHEHEGEAVEEATLSSTLFTENLEYYIEYESLVVGKESGFLVHVTDLQTYEPVSTGQMSIEIDGKKSVAEGPERPGIFHISFTPVEEGEHTIVYTFKNEAFVDLLSAHVNVGAYDHDEGHIEGDGHDHDGEEHMHAQEGDDHAHDNDDHSHAEEDTHNHEADQAAAGEIIFLKEQAWKSDFMVEKVKVTPFSSVISASGQILAVPGEKKHLPARSSGILLFQNKNLVQGSGVEKGQTLFIISAATLGSDNFELQYRELKNSLEESRSVFKRHESLFADKVISERQFIESKTAYTGDSIRFFNLASKVSERGLKITSPISGYIHELNFSEGQYVQLGEQIVTISSNKNLLLKADVAMQNFLLVDKIEMANFRTSYSDRIYTIEELNGELLTKGFSVAENDHFIPVYFDVENDGTLLEGAYVEFFLKTAEKKESIVIPKTAVSEELGAHYLYIQVTGESYTKRAVELGGSDGSQIEIKSGLAAGERIVTHGVMLLKAASMVSIGDSHQGHNH